MQQKQMSALKLLLQTLLHLNSENLRGLLQTRFCLVLSQTICPPRSIGENVLRGKVIGLDSYTMLCGRVHLMYTWSRSSGLVSSESKCSLYSPKLHSEPCGKWEWQESVCQNSKMLTTIWHQFPLTQLLRDSKRIMKLYLPLKRSVEQRNIVNVKQKIY